MTRYLLFVLLALGLSLSACKKNKTATYTIKGQVTDGNLGSGVAGATVLLQVKEVSGGTFNGNYRTISTKLTDGSGNYSFTFDRVNAIDYKISVSKSQHFGTEEVINPDNLSTDSDNTKNYSMNAMAWIRVKLKNVNPDNANDVIIYQLTSGAYDCGSACCGSTAHEFEGTTVDTTFVCLNDGNHDVTGTGFVTKNGQNSSIDETVFLVPFDTTDLIINY